MLKYVDSRFKLLHFVCFHVCFVLMTLLNASKYRITRIAFMGKNSMNRIYTYIYADRIILLICCVSAFCNIMLCKGKPR